METDKWSTRSLTDGRVLVSFPSPSQVSGGGRWFRACSDDPSPATFLATATGRVAYRLTSAEQCSGRGVTSDGEHVLNTDMQDGAYSTVRITAITTGDAWDFVLPAVPPGTGPVTGTFPWLSVLSTPSGVPPKILFGTGTSVFRLAPTSRNVVATREDTTLSEDGRYVLLRDRGSVEVVDRSSARRLAHRAVEEPSRIDGVGDHFSDPIAVTRQGTRYQLTTYPLPGLTPSAATDLPAGARVPDTDLIGRSLDARRLALILFGTLSVWDLPTGRMVAGPIDLGGSDDDKRGLHVRPRPRHPDQVLVYTDGKPVQLWSLAEKRLVATLPAASAVAVGDGVAFDQTGDRLAVIAEGRRVEVWDVERTARQGSPFVVPNAWGLLGLTDDGYLVVRASVSEPRWELWDLERHSLSGDLLLGSAESAGDVVTDPDPLRLNGQGVMPAEVPLSAAVWAERLCAAFAGPFSDAEASLLPSGVNRDDPCAGLAPPRRQGAPRPG